MKKSLITVLACTALLPIHAGAQGGAAKAAQFQAVPELPYRVVTNFFKFSKGMTAGEASGVAVNSKGHIFLFQRTKPMLAEYDEKGNFIQSIGDGLFLHPHGLRIDADDNIWTTDDGSHLVLKLDPSGNILLVLGRINTGAEANWLFNRPADVAFANNGDVYVADGYGNSRVVKFDRDGNYIKAWESTERGSVNSICLIVLLSTNRDAYTLATGKISAYKSLIPRVTSFNSGLESATRMVW
jgi:hypothetical protein